jgi:ABC-type xylose transport system permease subunit
VAKYNVNINRLLRAFALVLIIVAAVFLIVAGYTEQQIAPVMGLLGTIAGYLLGSRHSSGESGDEEKQKA